jgi:hypothetical protein
MPLNPLAPVTDYQSMLNRIFWFTTVAALAAIWLLRLRIPALNQSLSQVDFAVAFGSGKVLPTPAGYLLPALAIGIAAHIFRLHTRISDVLGIRECFDIDVIIAEFATRLSVDLSLVEKERLRRARHGIMREAFYPYVSSSPPKIDQQLVQQALDAWSWFWIGVVATFLFSLASLALIACRAHTTGLQTLAATLFIAVVALPAIRNQCKRYAIAQVRAILSDAQRAVAIRDVLQQLAGEPSHRRTAA